MNKEVQLQFKMFRLESVALFLIIAVAFHSVESAGSASYVKVDIVQNTTSFLNQNRNAKVLYSLTKMPVIQNESFKLPLNYTFGSHISGKRVNFKTKLIFLN